MADQGATSHNDSLSDEDLEAQMYAMVHYSNDSAPEVTIPNDMATNSTPEQSIVIDCHKSKENNTSRYWKRDVQSTLVKNTTFSKVNVRKDDNRPKEEDLNISKNNTKDTANIVPTNTVIKSNTKEKSPIDPVFQTPIMENAVITIELLNDDNKHVVTLESSDGDDDVIEVQLPPKPTICIESSDDEELLSVPVVPSPVEIPLNVTTDDKTPPKSIGEKSKTKPSESCTSPVPSVVSSVSDDFIRSDCAALNISSRSQECYKFNFNLHGTDLVDEKQNNLLTSKSKKKKNKQKQKEKQDSSNVTPDCSVPIHDPPPAHSAPESVWKEYFATPKSKVASKKKEKSKVNIPNLPVKGPEKLLNVPEDQSIIRKEVCEQKSSVESSLKDQCSNENINLHNSSIIDLTENIKGVPSPNDLVIANIVGQVKPTTSSENNRSNLVDEFKNRKRTFKPTVLNLNVDFEFHPFGSKETDRYNHDTRVYSIQSCVNDMDKFYNMSWGGEEFDHVKILKSMPRDKGLWHVDPSDRYHNNKRRNACHKCNRFGHREDRCPLKIPTCYMCGLTGHWETRCPYKICLNCGNKNHLYTSTCRMCSNWHKVFCNVCSNYGHTNARCPDHWRRYHLTVDNVGELTFGRGPQEKPRYNLHCTGCSQRGHILNQCRNVMPFNSYSPATPFIVNYTASPAYLRAQGKNIPPLFPNENVATPIIDKKKSEVPTTSTPTPNMKCQANVTPSSVKHPNVNTPFKKIEENAKSKAENLPEIGNVSLVNHKRNQKKAYLLQDNEVSNTDNAIMTAKMLLTKDYNKKFSTPAGQEFLKSEAAKHNIEYIIGNSNIGDELNIKGTGENQVEFQNAVREWLEVPKPEVIEVGITMGHIPKKGFQITVKLRNALQYLRLDIGDPKEIYKDYKALEKVRKHILKEKTVGQKKLKNIRNKLNHAVKKLNMILLGQAGLAEGSMHLNELYTLRDILQGCQNTVTDKMRAKVAEHYNPIFSAVHRTDYDVLISKYYESRHEQSKQLQICTPNTAAAPYKPTIINSKPIESAPFPKVGNGSVRDETQVLLGKLYRSCSVLEGAVLKSCESVQRRKDFITRLKRFEFLAKRYGLTAAKRKELTQFLVKIDYALPLLK